MSIPNTFLARRNARRQVEATQSMLTFSLRQEWFAFPAPLVQKVLTLGETYGSTTRGISLTLYQERELPVMDLESRIYGDATAVQAYLLVVPNLQAEWVGLAIATCPVLQRIPERRFAPLSSTYLAEGGLHCVKGLILPQAEEPAIFLLDLPQLLQPAMLALPQ